MSGGSFNYLYGQDPLNEDDLRNMIVELQKRGMHEAAAETSRFIPPKPDEKLLNLWQAIEWHVSNDWSEAQVARAFVQWEQREK